MARPVMFLRTAQTEQRIDELEKEVARILLHLKLNEPTPSDEEWEQAQPVRVAQSVERVVEGHGGGGSTPSPDTKQKAKKRA